MARAEKMLFDVHAHLDFEQFDPDRREVIDRARSRDISVICSGLGPSGILKTLEIAKSYENVYATLGLSPTEFDEKLIEETIALIRKHRDSIVGIGEVGLDHYWVKDEEGRDQELVNFQAFIDLSKDLGLPLVIHSRDAEKQTIDMLRKNRVPALMHCFSGSLEEALDAISLGCLISIPASVAYSKSKKRLAKNLPLESLVFETDAPYLSPTPKTRNEPVNVRDTCALVADLKALDPGVVEEVTSRNVASFFDLKPIKA